MTDDDYDGNRDAYLSWQLGIATIRRHKLIKGEVEPINDAEWELVAASEALRLLYQWLEDREKP